MTDECMLDACQLPSAPTTVPSPTYNLATYSTGSDCYPHHIFRRLVAACFFTSLEGFAGTVHAGYEGTKLSKHCSEQ